MRRNVMRAGVMALGALGLVACAPETGVGFGELSPVTTAATAAGPAMQQEAQLISLINMERTKRGLVALQYNPALSKAAQLHANDLVARNYFSHKGKNGSSVGDRVRAQGYAFCVVSENLSGGYPTVQKAMEGWMESKGHRANILNAQVRDVGIGVAAGGIRVAVFARGC